VSGLTFWETLYAPDFKMPAHCHRNAFLYLVRQGVLTEVCDWKSETAHPSTLIFHPSGQLHANHFLGAGARVFNVELDSGWLDRLQACSLVLDAPAYFQGGHLVGLAARLYEEARETDPASRFVVEGLALELLAQMARHSVSLAERTPPHWLQQARELLHEQFSASLTLSEIASVVGVHPVHLASSFRRHFGCTVGDYVRRLRIESSSHQLIQSDVPLSEIALDAGFANQSHFTRTFRRLMGTTPAAYRKFFSQRPN
jgi:AraC family transcriptional regulator